MPIKRMAGAGGRQRASGWRMKKDQTIEKILAAANSEITARGIDGAKIERIAKEAGVTKQLIYHYFKTKDQLYSAILESTARNMNIFSDVDRYKKMAPEEAICSVVDMIVDEFIRNPSYAALTLDQALHDGEHISEQSLFIPNIKQFVAEVLSPILQRGAEAGVFKSPLNPEIIFWVIFNLASASFLNQKVMSAASSVDFATPEGIELWREEITTIILRGLQNNR